MDMRLELRARTEERRDIWFSVVNPPDQVHRSFWTQGTLNAIAKPRRSLSNALKVAGSIGHSPTFTDIRDLLQVCLYVLLCISHAGAGSKVVCTWRMHAVGLHTSQNRVGGTWMSVASPSPTSNAQRSPSRAAAVQPYPVQKMRSIRTPWILYLVDVPQHDRL